MRRRQWLARDDVRRRHFPDIVLRTHHGKKVRFYQDLLRDRVVMLNFMHVACSDGTCPVVSHNLARVQRILGERVGRDIFMYSITLNPERDTPGRLAAYARQFDAGPGWLFLQADPQDTQLLRRRLGCHAALVRYGNEPRTLWGSTVALVDPQVTARAILWVADARA